MSNLRGKHILLGISGGIAAYKVADLCSRLTRDGAVVQVMMTAAATAFVSAMSFQALSGHPVHLDTADSQAAGGMKHIELARWADVILVAPASANTIARLAHGQADNLLTTVCLASEAIKCFAPAMNRVMWSDPATRENCQTLLDRGWYQFGPDSGRQACGEMGEGRLQTVDNLLTQLGQCFESGLLHGLNVIITAGPTREAIDPVRYISNRSSGRMGYALATSARQAGAHVTLVSGPCVLDAPEVDRFVEVESAQQMQQAVLSQLGDCDIFIATAAVADYRPAQTASQKIKKRQDTLTLTLVRNPDILAEVAAMPQPPFTVGFAAETENLRQHAVEKLQRKGLDMVIANLVGASPASGFDSDYNQVQVYSRQHPEQAVKLKRQRKTRLAEHLIELIARNYRKRPAHHQQKQTS